ncbi:transcriptional regulator SplA domain-containing protein [Bacillus velezensis]|nr:transcriptional regulator SplA domain-containing protein [Bacillus velezensis]WRT05539.1 transcriptional regulator SplA domain-containing protein [Bacillus velezensis]
MKKREEQYINEAEYVPHPTKEGEYALLLHESYHFLSEEDESDLSE